METGRLGDKETRRQGERGGVECKIRRFLPVSQSPCLPVSLSPSLLVSLSPPQRHPSARPPFRTAPPLSPIRRNRPRQPPAASRRGQGSRKPASTGRRPPESPLLRRMPCDTLAGHAAGRRRPSLAGRRGSANRHGPFPQRTRRALPGRHRPRRPLPPAAPASAAAACRAPTGCIASPRGAAPGSHRPTGFGHRARRRFAGQAAWRFRQTKNTVLLP